VPGSRISALLADASRAISPGDMRVEAAASSVASIAGERSTSAGANVRKCGDLREENRKEVSRRSLGFSLTRQMMKAGQRPKQSFQHQPIFAAHSVAAADSVRTSKPRPARPTVLSRVANEPSARARTPAQVPQYFAIRPGRFARFRHAPHRPGREPEETGDNCTFTRASTGSCRRSRTPRSDRSLGLDRPLCFCASVASATQRSRLIWAFMPASAYWIRATSGSLIA